MAHSRFSPSSAHRWVACTGSIVLEAHVPEQTSVYAEEGTAAHELASMALTHQCRPHEFIGQCYGDFEYTEEMADFVEEYTAFILARNGDAWIQGVEQRVDLCPVLGDKEPQFGTVDFFLCRDGVLEVHDLKYGLGVQVDAKENKQLSLYAAGILALVDLIEPVSTVELYIHQPRLYRLSSWSAPRAYFELQADLARQAVDAVQAKKHTFTPSTDTCRFCKAKPICRAAANHVMEVIDGL
jgi:hypothetical protein